MGELINMICPICSLKGIRVVSPVWFKEKSIEACCDCIKKYELKSISVKYQKDGGVRYPMWKVQRPAEKEGGLI